jgi:hypothetical protein
VNLLAISSVQVEVVSFLFVGFFITSCYSMSFDFVEALIDRPCRQAP